MRCSASWSLLMILILALASISFAAEPLQWQAGVSRATITPDQPMWMSGYASRDRPADGKLTELWAKALVLVDPKGHRSVIITLDLIGVDRQLSQLICRQLKSRYGFERDQIAILCSHTHTGPALRRNLAPLHYLLVNQEQQSRIDAYTDSLAPKLVSLVGHAVDNIAHCQIHWGHGTASFAVNRRENRPEGDVRRRRREQTLKGPVDHSVPVLAVRDHQGKLKAVVFGYACHATVLSSYQWSGDYPGFAQIELEKLYPDCVAMFWAGCGADQNPLPRRKAELARHYGRRLANAVEAVLLTSELQQVRGELKTSYREINLEFAEIPNAEQVAKDAQSTDRYTAARARLFQDMLNAGDQIPRTYPFPTSVWKLGNDLQWIMLGGEVVVDYAIRLKTELPADSTWVAGYANDVMAYIPSRRVLLEGGYEGGGAMVYYGLPSAWAMGVEKQIVDAVRTQTESPTARR